MGVFDDAIREHLELKRQHGVSEEELKQQEDEAFGRRQPTEAGTIPEDVARELEPAPPEYEPAAAGEPATTEAEPAELLGPPAEAPEPPVQTAPAEFEEPTEPPPEEPPAEEPEESPEFLEEAQEAVEIDDDDRADVLEDTPDFLRESPEHDKLWFEQKPPKDFDFDED